jgi:hypothetical protein
VSDAKATAPITAKRSYHKGCVGIGIQLRCNGWNTASATINASTDLTIEQARALAQSLIQLADLAEAKIAAEAASVARRKKWRDREIAAGRMVVMGSWA